MFRPLLIGVVGVFAVAVVALSAQATAPPVGPLPKGPVTTIGVQHGQLFAIVVPRPGTGLTWRGARQSDATIARPLDEGELNGNIVFVYRAGRAGKTTVVYALTKDEGPKALQARYFKISVAGNARVRCSTDPQMAARYIIPPPPFVARIIVVKRQTIPAGEPSDGGPNHMRLYRVTFEAVKGNAVLPSGHRYTQYAYVVRKTTTAPWCFLKGGSGP
ncbi:MAG: hypothetical protein ACXVRK_11730 [Gaiellaceae bacterium]